MPENGKINYGGSIYLGVSELKLLRSALLIKQEWYFVGN
jgi:hypothetical protein